MQCAVPQLNQASGPSVGLRHAPLQSPSDTISGGSSQPARILIVEDDYFVSLQIEHSLTASGFEVTGIARTAQEAIEMAAVQKPDLVIMDIRLGGQRDGIDAAVELIEAHGISSIFATAHSDAETRRRAEKANPLAWLEKPYSSKSLVDAVKAALQASSRRDS